MASGPVGERPADKAEAERNGLAGSGHEPDHEGRGAEREQQRPGR